MAIEILAYEETPLGTLCLRRRESLSNPGGYALLRGRWLRPPRLFPRRFEGRLRPSLAGRDPFREPLRRAGPSPEFESSDSPSKPSTSRRVIGVPIMRSVARTQAASSPVTKVQALPSCSDRPVRPMRWV